MSTTSTTHREGKIFADVCTTGKRGTGTEESVGGPGWASEAGQLSVTVQGRGWRKGKERAAAMQACTAAAVHGGSAYNLGYPLWAASLPVALLTCLASASSVFLSAAASDASTLS